MSAERLKVLHCIYDDVRNPWVAGGGARRVAQLYRHLENTVDVTIATGSYPGAVDGKVDGLSFRRLGSGITHIVSRLTYFIAAARLLRSAVFDVAVIDHSGYAPVFIPLGRPVGMTVHHLTGPEAPARWGIPTGTMIAWIERVVVQRPRVVSATSAATELALRNVVDQHAVIERVAAGVHDRLFDLERIEQGYVLFLGRLDETQKGLDVLLDAWVRVAQAHSTAELRIAGTGPHHTSLEARARRLGIQSSVRFLGNVSDAERALLLRGALCQVVPSRFEGFGIVAAEGAAAGVPLIVSDASSLVEIAGEGLGGLVVARGDSVALANALITLISDQSMRERLSREGRESAERFRWSVVANAHLHFLREIILDHRRRDPGASASRISRQIRQL